MLQKTQEVLELIANDELFENNDIRFVGGTALAQVWVFIVAPCIGAALAAVVYNVLYKKTAE